MGSTGCSCQEALCAQEGLYKHCVLCVFKQEKKSSGLAGGLGGSVGASSYRHSTYMENNRDNYISETSWSKSSVGRSCSILPKTYETHICIYIYIFFFKCHSFVLVHKLSNAWIYEYLKQVLQCTQGPGLVGVAIVSWLCSKLLARATSSTMV